MDGGRTHSNNWVSFIGNPPSSRRASGTWVDTTIVTKHMGGTPWKGRHINHVGVGYGQTGRHERQTTRNTDRQSPGRQTEGRQTQTHLTTTSPDDDNESDPAFIRATMSPSPVCADDRRRNIQRPVGAQWRPKMTWPPPPNACNGAINGALATQWRVQKGWIPMECP